jgi:glutamate-1-semialdehyde 2,1-aminomutase
MTNSQNSSEHPRWQRQLKLTPLGGQTLSKLPERFVSVYPKMLDGGKGCVVRGSNGWNYIDLIAGLGAVSVGYNNNRINRAVVNQLAKGVSFSLPNSLEADVAEKLCQLMPEMEMWKYAKSGTQANEYAVRAARAYTGRTKILTIGYNGCNDQFEILGTRNAGVPKCLGTTIDKVVFNELFRSHEKLACVLLEPMVFDEPNTGFLEWIRSECDRTGTLLIFDEVVTGGRFEGFAAYRHFNVIPDIVTVGKGLANGFPLAAVGGKRSIMSTFERDDFFASGTFNGEAISLAAALETLHILEEQIPEMVRHGSEIKTAFNQLFKGKAVCKGYPTRLKFEFPSPEHKALWMQQMCLEGVLTSGTNFIMADATDADVKWIINEMIDTHKFMSMHWDNPKEVLEGPLPTEVLLRR